MSASVLAPALLHYQTIALALTTCTACLAELLLASRRRSSGAHQWALALAVVAPFGVAYQMTCVVLNAEASLVASTQVPDLVARATQNADALGLIYEQRAWGALCFIGTGCSACAVAFLRRSTAGRTALAVAALGAFAVALGVAQALRVAAFAAPCQHCSPAQRASETAARFAQVRPTVGLCVALAIAFLVGAGLAAAGSVRTQGRAVTPWTLLCAFFCLALGISWLTLAWSPAS